MSEPLEFVEQKFLSELARRTDINTIFCVSAALGMDRTAIEKDREDNPENTEAVGKAFIRRWNANNNDPQMWHRLRKAYDEAHCIGPFESVASGVGFQLPSYGTNNYAQVELSADPESGLDFKLNNFMEQLPRLISTKNILWDVGIYSGLNDDEIQSIKENNPGNINQAGREVLRTTLKKSKGTLRSDIRKLQNVFETANKVAPFVELLRKNGIEPEDLVEAGEGETATTNNQIQLPTNNETQASHNHSLVPPSVQVGGVQSTLKDLAEAVAREGTYDETEAFYAASKLQNPTVDTIKEWLRNHAYAVDGATANTRPKLQGSLHESGYSSMSSGR